jgi:uncharacterized protein YndB with AHSA1/START domain
MSSSAKQGFLVVADITGYTSYLSHSELEHAKDVLKTLLDLLIDHTRPPLALSGLEGDAVLSYAIDSDRFEGQAFVEMIEQTYVAFKRAIDLMVMNTSCDCNACANINTLDLKFFVHHGEFVLQELGGGEELVGSDVNLIHRLMKNTVVEGTGFRAYTFYTEAAIDQLGLDGFSEELAAHAEVLDDVGEVRGRVMDMTPIWEANKNSPSLDVDERRTVRFVEEYLLPPEQVWGYLTNPEYRSIFSNAKRQVTHDRRNGKVGLGTVYECFHMDNSTSTNTVLEWQPFSRIVTENTAGRSSRFISIFELEPIATGSRVTMKWTPLQGPLLDKLIGFPLFFLKYKPLAHEGMAKLRQLIEEDIANGRVSIPESVDVTNADRDAAADAALTGLSNE